MSLCRLVKFGSKTKDMGYNISTLVSIDAEERIIFTVPVSDFEEERYLLFTTKNGLIKEHYLTTSMRFVIQGL